jgi:hypothetical protein
MSRYIMLAKMSVFFLALKNTSAVDVALSSNVVGHEEDKTSLAGSTEAEMQFNFLCIRQQ